MSILDFFKNELFKKNDDKRSAMVFPVEGGALGNQPKQPPLKGNQKIKEFILNDIMRAFPRAVGSVGLTLSGKDELKIQKTRMIDNVMRGLLGVDSRTASPYDRPLKSISGVGETVAPNAGPTGTFIIGSIFTGLDLIPDFGVKGSVKKKIPDIAEQISKLTEPSAIRRELEKIFVKNDKLDEVSQVLVNKNNPEEITKDILNSVSDETKQRGFARTVQKLENIDSGVSNELDLIRYSPITNKGTLDEATDFINKTGYDDSIGYISSLKKLTAKDTAISELLIRSELDAGRYTSAVNLIDKASKLLTEAGQAIQAVRIFANIGESGIVQYAARQLKKAGVSNEVLTPEVITRLRTQASKVEKMADGTEDKLVETALLQKMIADLIPVSAWKKVGLIQTMAQLLNFKTIGRNIIGNSSFYLLDKAAGAIAPVFDSALSLITKKKTVSFGGVEQFKKEIAGGYDGFRQGVRDAIMQIDTAGVNTAFELPKNVFRKGPMKKAEIALNIVLRGPDRAAYRATYDGSLYNQMKAAGVTEPTDEMIETAHFEGLYRTFQDDNKISWAFQQIKRVANLNQDFGLGDFILKYPKTPANLIARGIDYSPAGVVNVLSEVVRASMGRGFNQRKFSQALARATTGTIGLVGMGALLRRTGIITGDGTKDKDLARLESEIGAGRYKFNLDAAKRFIMGGFDPRLAELQDGDRMYSYDWLQPTALPLAMGANMEDAEGDGFLNSILTGVTSGLNTIAEQPLISNLSDLFIYSRKETFSQDIVGQLVSMVPQSFIPTILSQITQLIDPYRRDVYVPGSDMRSSAQTAWNLTKRKIPGLSQTINPSVGVFGDELEGYYGKNNIFNVFFNPSFSSRVDLTKEAKMVIDLYKEEGQVEQAPRSPKTRATINGEYRTLTPDEKYLLQKYVGGVTHTMFKNVASNRDFSRLSTEDQVDYLSKILTEIGKAGESVILKDEIKLNKDGSVKGSNIYKQLISDYFNRVPYANKYYEMMENYRDLNK